MFTLEAIAEYALISLALALLLPLCTFKMLGALQQSGYDGKKFAKWTVRKGNMVYSRYILLAFLIALSSAVLALVFSFAGSRAAYIALVPFPLFVAVYCYADKKALKVPLVSTKRVQRVYLWECVAVFIVSAALAAGGGAAAHYAGVELVSHLRYLPLAVLPILLPLLLRAANAVDRPFSEAKNRKYLRPAREKLHAAQCVKIGITGSFGKTSVKNFIADLLSRKYKVFATPESYNTPLGIAKAIENVDLNEYDVFLAEMGARREGDIRELCDLVAPDHCVVTGICPQHVETFGSLEKVISAKGEILSGTKQGGYAFIGMDENTEKLDASAAKLVKVGVGEHGECGARDIRCSASGIDFKLALGVFETSVHSRLLGGHNARNLALAAAVAYKMGLTKEEIVSGIGEIGYVPHRLQPVEANGVTVLDDAYNANIVGAEEAVKVLRLFPGRKYIVTPGIVELGVLEEEENYALGEKLAGLDQVVLVGATLVLAVKRGYLAAGGDAEKIAVVPDLAAAEDLLSERLQSGDAVLFLNDLPDIYN